MVLGNKNHDQIRLHMGEDPWGVPLGGSLGGSLGEDPCGGSLGWERSLGGSLGESPWVDLLGGSLGGVLQGWSLWTRKQSSGVYNSRYISAMVDEFAKCVFSVWEEITRATPSYSLLICVMMAWDTEPLQFCW